MTIVAGSIREAVLTGEVLASMGDRGSSELVEGRIVPMSPTGDLHGGCELAFGVYIRDHVRRHGLGKVRVGEVGIYTRRNPDSIRAADVLYISNERYAARVSSGYLDVAPDLVVEILSPSDSWSVLMQKLREYFGIGVRLVWVADPATQTVHAFKSTTDVQEYGPEDVLPGDDVLPGFRVDVAALFAE